MLMDNGISIGFLYATMFDKINFGRDKLKLIKAPYFYFTIKKTSYMRDASSYLPQ